MKILFLSTENPYPPDHGHHIRTWNILKILAAEHEVHFVAFAQNDDGFQHIDKLENLCKTVKVFRLPYTGWKQGILALKMLLSDLPLIADKYYLQNTVKYINDLRHKFDIDLVHIDMLHLVRYRELFNGAHAVLTNHNVESVRMQRWSSIERRPYLKKYLKRESRKLTSFEALSCAKFDLICTVSQSDLQTLKKMSPESVFEVVPNGVDIGYFDTNKTDETANGIVWTGGMSGAYNRDAVNYFLTDLWPIIKRKHESVTATFVGDCPTDLLQRQARQDAAVTYTGYVQDVRPYVAGASVFVAPLRAGSGTKIKILNAMAQGKPVVTTSIGAEGIDASSEQGLFEAQSDEDFAEKTVSLLRSPDRASKAGQRAHEFIVENYDWNVIGRKLLELYARVNNTADLKKSGQKPPSDTVAA